jgi:hypothetical protein
MSEQLYPLGTSNALKKAWNITTLDGADRKWREQIMYTVPESFHEPMIEKYIRLNDDKGLAIANRSLSDDASIISPAIYRIASSDDDLISQADAIARQVELAVKKTDTQERAYEVAAIICEVRGIEPQEYDNKKKTMSGAINRMCSEEWWRRKLRRLVSIRIENSARELGLVSRRRGLFVSDETMKRRGQQRRRNRRILEQTIATNETGDSYTLQELSDKTVSNPEHRRGELMTRSSGMEAYAEEQGHVVLFLTLTTPSRFHARHSGSGKLNEKFDGSSPADGQEHLSTVWKRCRAKMQRNKILFYGFRVAEPHHDGTPHWHVMLYCKQKDTKLIREICRFYTLQESPDEDGAQKVRYTCKQLDMANGRATSYLAKYIAKNIDGHKLGGHDESTGESLEGATAAQRVDAWAACWRIRQFQTFGNPTVTAWRELRLLSEPTIDTLEPARLAADAGDWKQFMELVLEPGQPRCDASVSIAYANSIDLETGEIVLDKYGDEANSMPVGLLSCGVVVKTRLHTWTISYQKNGGVAPWCSVTNCTPDDKRHPWSSSRIMAILSGQQTAPPHQKVNFNG